MMRHHSSVALGLAALFVLPASLPGGQDPISLADRLEATIAAIEQIGGIEPQIHSGDRGALTELLLLTEAPIPGAQRRDESLSLLRTEVAALQQRWDELTTTGSPFRQGTQAMPAPTDGHVTTSPGNHTGLAPGALAQTLLQARPARPQAAPTGEALQQFEKDEAYSADSLRQGRLLVRAERWQDALALLEPLTAEAEARYWIACCYEGLGRTGEAIELLRTLVAAGQPDPNTQVEVTGEARNLARRANYNLKFLELRRELDDRRQGQEQVR